MKTLPVELNLERLRRLPAGSDVWQLAVRPTPQWVIPDDDAKGEPFRPLIALCRSLKTGLVGFGDLALPSEAHAGIALRAVVSLTREGPINTRPAAIEVRDPALREAIGPALAAIGVDVLLTERLESIDQVIADMIEKFGGRQGALRLFSAEVTIDQLRSFAEAALAFDAAAPWNHLGNHDLVHVETRSAPEGLRWFLVLGAAELRQGIAFLKSQSEFVDLTNEFGSHEGFARTPHWSITFDLPYMIPMGEFERWDAHALPRTADGLVPVLSQLSRRGLGKPVEAARLDFAAALLRAVAATTEDELDEGRWSKTVRTAGGEQTLTLALPELLLAESAKNKGKKPFLTPGELPDRRLLERETAKIGRLVAERKWESVEEINAFLATNVGKPLPATPVAGPRGEAQELFYSALEARGRRRIKLARQAVHLWPDCADALVLLAEETPSSERSCALYRSAMEAAERELGPEAFVEDRGHFWRMHETRPYMRARHGLADRLWKAGERDAAVDHWLGMLDLNPGDNQGVRHVVIPHLLELGRDADAAAMLDSHGDEDTAMMNFAAALASFRLHGKGGEVDRRLAAAVRANPHAVKYLLDADNMPLELPEAYRMGSDEEAILLADNLGDAWRATPGAVAWLREQRREAKKLREQKRKKRGGM